MRVLFRDRVQYRVTSIEVGWNASRYKKQVKVILIFLFSFPPRLCNTERDILVRGTEQSVCG